MTLPVSLVYEAFRRQKRNEQQMDLSGVGHYHYDENERVCGDEECLGLAPMTSMRLDLEYAQIEFSNLLVHQHEWNENGFCFCGWDGNV